MANVVYCPTKNVEEATPERESSRTHTVPSVDPRKYHVPGVFMATLPPLCGAIEYDTAINALGNAI
jgi:hypothetical protein